MNQKTIFITAAALLVLAFGTGAVLYKRQQAEQAGLHAAANTAALARPASPTRGNPNAPVHIVEFLDPACETCAQFAPLVKEMMEAHPNQIRLTVRYAPFHPGSDQVVMLLEAARKQGKYWQALEGLLEAQPYWVVHHAAQVDSAWKIVDGLGLGVDMEQARRDAAAPAMAALVTQELQDAQTLNVTKTPEFFVNGKPLPSFGIAQLRQLVDEALAAAH